MSRDPWTGSHRNQLGLRLDSNTYDRLDRLVELVKEEAPPGARVTRHSVALWLLENAIEEEEKRRRG